MGLNYEYISIFTADILKVYVNIYSAIDRKTTRKVHLAAKLNPWFILSSYVLHHYQKYTS